MRLRYILATLLGFSHTALGFGLTQDSLSDQVEQYNYFTNSPATLATYCVQDDCMSVAAGHTSFDRNTLAAPHNLVSIGSNSKLITSVLTLKLAEQGQLGLDQELVEFFPGYARWKGVTIRHLLQHASGVPPYLFSRDGARRTILSVFNWSTRIWKPEDIVGLVANKPLLFEPGSRVEYNNTNYVLLGMIAQKATGRALGDLLKDEVFAPLEMNDTFLTLPAWEKGRRLSGYLPMNIPLSDWLFNIAAQKVNKKGDYLDTTSIFHDSMTWAAGGMLSTTSDMSKLLRGLFRGQFLSQASLAAMADFRSGTVLGFPFFSGLGLMKLPSEYGDLKGHGGLTPGYQTLSNYLPDRDITLNLVQNLGPSQLYSIYYDLLDVVVGTSRFQEFEPSDAVRVERIPTQGVHLRFYGRITNGEKRSSPFPRGFGFAQLKSSQAYTAFQAFDSRVITLNGRPYVEIEASSGGNFLAGSNLGETKTPFMKVLLDQAEIQRGGPQLFLDTPKTDTIFVYRGFKTLSGTEVKGECVIEAIDRTKPLAFQIDSQADEGFNLNDTLKFVGNLPLRRVTANSVPPELRDSSIGICP